MIALGLTNAEVAGRLGVTVHAVKFHLSHVYQKLGVSNRTEAAVAFQLGSLGEDGNSDGREPEAPEGTHERLMQLRDQLQRSSPSVALPADRLRTLPGGATATETAELGVEAQRAVEVMLTESSIEAVGMAGFAALMHRYAGEQALTFAFAEPGRESLFVVPVDVSPELNFGELLQHVSISLEAARRHPALTLAELRLALDPDELRDPLFPLLFLSELGETDGYAFDLAVTLNAHADGVYASAVFPTELFDRDTIVRMLGHLEVVLAGAAAEPACTVKKLPLIPEPERKLLLDDWNSTLEPFPARCLHELLEERSAALGDRAAAVGGDLEWSYASLDARSNQLAQHLLDLGVAREEPVGICVERSPWMLVGLLGILKAGAAYVPIDPTYPEERQAFMLEDAQVRVIVTEEHLASALPRTDARLVCLDRDRPIIEAASTAAPTVESDPEQLAYLIYTSGSTGKPKGVEISHRALVNFLNTMLERPGLGPDDVLLAVTTLSFDIAGLELYLPLLAGGTVVIASQQAAGDPRRLMELMKHHGVTAMQATPTTWRMLIDAGWSGQPGMKVLCGGEALPVLLAEQLLDLGVELWNMYGPTETTIWSTTHRLTPGEPLTIGRPIGNTTIYVLDEELELTPIGVPGELHIGGEGLARGYRGRPDLTAERFIPHPLDRTPGSCLYKTGDLVRYRSDGCVEFLGRLDHQVKVRGFRIELGEIESVLARHPAVAGAVALAREDTPGDARIVAYVVLDGRPAAATELRDHAAGSLPAYMVPSAVVILERFPQTLNGKVDRKALPAPTYERDDESEYVAPRTPLEQQLVEIWEEVLGVRPIGVRDDFFELGATSIVAARLFASIEKELGSELPLAPVFRAPTVEALASLLEGGSNGSRRWTSLVPIQPDGTKPPFFCVHGGAGTILHLQPLARRLGRDQPFYGLQARGLYGDDAPLTRVEEMAAHYITELRTVQASGPYYIAGYCFGTIVAFEMAHQLRSAGEEVALVAMFNGPSPPYIKSHPPVGEPAPVVVASRRVRHSRGGRVLRLLREPSRAISWARWMLGRVRLFFHEIHYKLRLASDRPLPERLRDGYFVRISFDAERRYQPVSYPGSLVIFRGAGLYDDPTLGWNPFSDEGVEAHEVSGAHSDNRDAMKEPHVGFIAEGLRKHLPSDDPGEELGSVAATEVGASA
jgi:amino acid adenylation domain-containing protein